MHHFDIVTLLTGSVASLVLSAAARALPEPLPMDNRVYRWFYKFTQILLANLDKSNLAK